MSMNIKQVVSMLANDKVGKTTLFTADGETIELRHDGPYDVEKLSEYLIENLTGTSAVEIDLEKYASQSSIINILDFANTGVQMSQTVQGRKVQGIFYPDVSAVEVTVGEDKVVIPHVDNLKAHMARAAKDGSPSVVNFFKRLAPVVQARKHSGEDLMKFIKRSEMPLTNDGRIIAYKRVTSHPEEIDFVVDTHSKKIKQRVGSRVTMPVDMVDPSRHNSCSTGLHVANLGYLRGFSGDKTLIVLVDPENFIAVPAGEDTKARVCSYDVIGMMTANSHQTVAKGNHISGDQTFEELIVSAVEGTHIQPIEEIFVGTKKITQVSLLEPEEEKAPLKSKNPTSGKSLEEDEKPEIQEKAPAKDVAKKARKAKGGDAIPENVKKVFDLLVSGKAKSEIAKLMETSTRTIGRWMEKHGYDAYIKEVQKAVKAPEPEKKVKPASSGKTPEKVKQALKETPNKKTPVKPVGGKISAKEEVQALFAGKKFVELIALKKKKKKSWTALGFTEAQVAEITKE